MRYITYEEEYLQLKKLPPVYEAKSKNELTPLRYDPFEDHKKVSHPPPNC